METDTETLQTILKGMGELHLEVIKDRLRSEYKLDVSLGPLIISYREMLEKGVTESISFDKIIGMFLQYFAKKTRLLLIVIFVPVFSEDSA